MSSLTGSELVYHETRTPARESTTVHDFVYSIVDIYERNSLDGYMSDKNREEFEKEAYALIARLFHADAP